MCQETTVPRVILNEVIWEWYSFLYFSFTVLSKLVCYYISFSSFYSPAFSFFPIFFLSIPLLAALFFRGAVLYIGAGSCLWVSQRTAGARWWVDVTGSPPLLLLILSASDDTCMSSALAPSANFTGRLKIKQGLPSLPVAQGNMCVCVSACICVWVYQCERRTTFIFGNVRYCTCGCVNV